jgi:hypothetical protein
VSSLNLDEKPATDRSRQSLCAGARAVNYDPMGRSPREAARIFSSAGEITKLVYSIATIISTFFMVLSDCHMACGMIAADPTI